MSIPYPPPRDDIDGDVLLNRLRTALQRYVVLPSEHATVAVVLWIAATHGQAAFHHAPRLAINSPEKRCGKSRLLDIIAATCHRPLVTVNATVAALFRSIDEDDPPTLLLDEADAIWSKNKAADSAEDLRALINAGHQRGRPALRTSGPHHTPTEFPTFCMAALAGIGDCLPDTVTDRAVCISMRRRSPGETVASYRHRRDELPLNDLSELINAWVTDHIHKLEDAEPAMPVEDRAGDTWEPLIAIADLAGGEWPRRARAAAVALVAEHESEETDASLGTKLLGDIKAVFATCDTAEIGSADLVHGLRMLEESPWDAFDLNPNKLSRRLSHYKIKPQQVRPDGTKQVRGYRLEDFADTFARYLADPPSQTVKPSQDQVKPVTVSDAVTVQGVTATETVTGLSSGNDGVTACDSPPLDTWLVSGDAIAD